MPSIRPFFILTCCGVFTLVLCWRLQYPDSLATFIQPILPNSFKHSTEFKDMSQDDPNSPITNTDTPEWSSKFAGYLSRATPHHSPESFTPSREILELTVLRNAQVEHSGFTLALFSDRTFVDHQGKVYTLTQEDYEGIRELATRITNLPEAHSFRHQWRVRQDRTGYPIDRVLVAKSQLSKVPAENYEEEYTEASVYGFDKKKTLLETPVEGYTHLAPSLYELLGLAQEARDTSVSEDKVVLDKVRDTLGNVF